MSNFFIAVDTYERCPRRFGIFKNRLGKTATHLVTVSVVTDEGFIYTALFSSATLSDDPAWDNIVINPADYGHKKSDLRIALELKEFVDKYHRSGPLNIYTVNGAHNAMQVIKDFYMALWGNIPHIFNRNGIPIKDYTEAEISKLPDEFFSKVWQEEHVDWTIRPDHKWPPSQRMMCFTNFHKRHPKMRDRDMSKDKAHKAFEIYNLVKRVKHEHSIA